MTPDDRPSVLLVEDNLGDVMLIRTAFKKDKILCHLSVVHDGQEALDFLQRKPPYEESPPVDLILLDLNMPKMNGTEFLDAVKHDDVLKRIPVVVLTSSDAEIDILKSYESGASAYITKPSGSESMEAIVKSISLFWLKAVHLPPSA